MNHEGEGQTPSSPSRLAKQLEIMGLGDGSIAAPGLVTERHAIDQALPRPLRFPSAKPSPLRWRERFASHAFFQPWVLGPAGLALAALCAMLYWQVIDAPPAVMVMGGDSLQIYVEQGGTVSTWDGKSPLGTEARIKVGVLAPAPSMAFLGVVSRDHRLLSDRDAVWRQRLDLATGGKATFAGSLQLDGASEGETVSVLICPLATAVDLQVVIAALVNGPTAAGPLAGCARLEQQLRP